MENNAAAKRNVFLLSAAQSVVGAAAPLSISIGGLAGFYLLGSDKSLATVPITAFNVGTALIALPAAMLMHRIGRRLGFMTGASIAICGMLIAGSALMVANFWMFALGLMFIGGGNSFTQQYRFAAADQGDEKFRVKAISWVLAGGVGAAVIGPQVVIFARDLLAPVEFAGAYFAGVGLLLCGIIILSFLKFENPMSKQERASADTGRPLLEIITQPRFMVSLICAIGSYTLMAFVMTGAPLAMIGCGISITDSTLGIQWHVMAMFGPSFFTGHLIARFGKERVVATGLCILIACAFVALSGLELWKFWLALILLGVGWNFGFIGATAMLTDCYRPEEKSKAQGANDFLLFGSVAFASFMSGQTYNAFGWSGLNYVIFPVVVLCLISLMYLVRHERKIAE